MVSLLKLPIYLVGGINSFWVHSLNPQVMHPFANGVVLRRAGRLRPNSHTDRESAAVRSGTIRVRSCPRRGRRTMQHRSLDTTWISAEHFRSGERNTFLGQHTNNENDSSRYSLHSRACRYGIGG